MNFVSFEEFFIFRLVRSILPKYFLLYLYIDNSADKRSSILNEFFEKYICLYIKSIIIIKTNIINYPNLRKKHDLI